MEPHSHSTPSLRDYIGTGVEVSEVFTSLSPYRSQYRPEFVTTWKAPTDVLVHERLDVEVVYVTTGNREAWRFYFFQRHDRPHTLRPEGRPRW